MCVYICVCVCLLVCLTTHYRGVYMCVCVRQTCVSVWRVYMALCAAVSGNCHLYLTTPLTAHTTDEQRNWNCFYWRNFSESLQAVHPTCRIFVDCSVCWLFWFMWSVLDKRLTRKTPLRKLQWVDEIISTETRLKVLCCLHYNLLSPLNYIPVWRTMTWCNLFVLEVPLNTIQAVAKPLWGPRPVWSDVWDLV